MGHLCYLSQAHYAQAHSECSMKGTIALGNVGRVRSRLSPPSATAPTSEESSRIDEWTGSWKHIWVQLEGLKYLDW